MGIQILYIPTQNQQIKYRYNIIITMKLRLYSYFAIFSIKGCTLSNFCQRLAQYVRISRKSFSWPYVPIQDQQTMIYIDTYQHNKAILLLCYLLYPRVYALQLLHTAIQPSMSGLARNHCHGYTNTLHPNSGPTNNEKIMFFAYLNLYISSTWQASQEGSIILLYKLL